MQGDSDSTTSSEQSSADGIHVVLAQPKPLKRGDVVLLMIRGTNQWQKITITNKWHGNYYDFTFEDGTEDGIYFKPGRPYWCRLQCDHYHIPIDHMIVTIEGVHPPEAEHLRIPQVPTSITPVVTPVSTPDRDEEALPQPIQSPTQIMIGEEQPRYPLRSRFRTSSPLNHEYIDDEYEDQQSICLNKTGSDQQFSSSDFNVGFLNDPSYFWVPEVPLTGPIPDGVFRVPDSEQERRSISLPRLDQLPQPEQHAPPNRSGPIPLFLRRLNLFRKK